MTAQRFDTPREILVRGPNWTGDVVMATPGFRALRERFPDARITLQIRPGLAPLLAGAPWFDAIREVNSYRQGVAAIWREGRALGRATRFDLGVCLPDSFSSALLMRAAGVRRIVGYARGWWRRPLLHVAVPPLRSESGSKWVARERHVLGLVKELGGSDQDTRVELFVTPEEVAEARRALAEHGMDDERPRVALAPGASFGPSKLWPAEYFAEVGDSLHQAGASVVLVGAPSERALSERVAAAMKSKPANLVGQIQLGGLKAVLRDARALVCNDAGARHVAVAFGVPCVVMMGPTSLEKTNLNLERVTVLSADVECRPCYKRECPIDHRCMTRIRPETVLEALPSLGGDRGTGA